jgi:GNAT superfamily N-acetyltransferase
MHPSRVIAIRPATANDALGIATVCAASLPFDPDAARLPAILGGPGHDLLVAEIGGDVTAVACATLRERTSGPTRGHVDLLAVAPRARGYGTGARLLSAAEDWLRTRGAAEVRLGAGGPVYLWPGVDPRYTAMTCLADRAGYERLGEAVNMTVDLRDWPGAERPDAEAGERRLAGAGLTVRRAGPAEAGALGRWLREGPWGASTWPAEAVRALANDPPGCHVAMRGDAYVGFACHGVSREAWFGPMGTLPSEQRHGIGAVLLGRCLADIRRAGHASAQIAWTGPVRFYARAAGARIDRLFWTYRKTLQP